MILRPPRSTLPGPPFPYTTLFRSLGAVGEDIVRDDARTHAVGDAEAPAQPGAADFLMDHRFVRASSPAAAIGLGNAGAEQAGVGGLLPRLDRKSTRLNSSH